MSSSNVHLGSLPLPSYIIFRTVHPSSIPAIYKVRNKVAIWDTFHHLSVFNQFYLKISRADLKFRVHSDRWSHFIDVLCLYDNFENYLHEKCIVGNELSTTVLRSDDESLDFGNIIF